MSALCLLCSSAVSAQSPAESGLAIRDEPVASAVHDVSPVATQLISFPIAGFDPAMSDAFDFRLHSLHFSATGNGAGTYEVVIEDDGTAWAEEGITDLRAGEKQQEHFFLTAVNVADASGFLFANEETMRLTAVASMLTTLYGEMHFAANPQASNRAFFRSKPLHLPSPEGLALTATIDGAWLSIADVQEQVFQQTRCHLELDQSVYYVAGCEP